VQRVADMGAQAAAMAGPAMRGERVLELAKARDCAWAKEGGGMPAGAVPGAIPPGAFPPGAVPPGALPPGAPGASR
jgi:hypothetical protein